MFDFNEQLFRTKWKGDRSVTNDLLADIKENGQETNRILNLILAKIPDGKKLETLLSMIVDNTNCACEELKKLNTKPIEPLTINVSSILSNSVSGEYYFHAYFRNFVTDPVTGYNFIDNFTFDLTYEDGTILTGLTAIVDHVGGGSGNMADHTRAVLFFPILVGNPKCLEMRITGYNTINGEVLILINDFKHNWRELDVYYLTPNEDEAQLDVIVKGNNSHVGYVDFLSIKNDDYANPVPCTISTTGDIEVLDIVMFNPTTLTASYQISYRVNENVEGINRYAFLKITQDNSNKSFGIRVQQCPPVDLGIEAVIYNASNGIPDYIEWDFVYEIKRDGEVSSKTVSSKDNAEVSFEGSYQGVSYYLEKEVFANETFELFNFAMIHKNSGLQYVAIGVPLHQFNENVAGGTVGANCMLQINSEASAAAKAVVWIDGPYLLKGTEPNPMICPAGAYFSYMAVFTSTKKMDINWYVDCGIEVSDDWIVVLNVSKYIPANNMTNGKCSFGLEDNKGVERKGWIKIVQTITNTEFIINIIQHGK